MADGIAEVQKERDAKLSARIDAIQEEFAEFKRQAVILRADKVQLFEIKFGELQKQCDVNKRHTQNLESKFSKSTNGLRGFTSD